MFDLQADDGSVRKRPYKSPIPADDPKAARPKRGNPLDTAQMKLFHLRLLDHWTRELDRQAENRLEMAQEEDFYDNIQWTAEDAQTLRERGQVPLVYNVISASVDWITGTEKRARTDFKVLPRRKEHGQPAERKTELLKYLSDVNRTPFHRSRAFEDATKVGIGWLEDGVQDEDEDEPVYSRYENWRNVLWDSAATDLDLSDGRYIFRQKWLDLDVAEALFPKRRSVLRLAASRDYIGLDQYGDEAADQLEAALEPPGTTRANEAVSGYERRRVRVIEAWIRIPKTVDRLAGGDFSGELFDRTSPAHVEQVETSQAEVRQKPAMRMHVAILTTAGMLWFSESPYRHNRFPLTPIWAYRRGRDGMPYGVIRRIKDIQTDVNKRASKALHILSTNKVIMDTDALPDDVTLDEFAEEVSRPDAIIRVKPGKRVDINSERDLSQYQLELMSRSIAMIQQASGVTDESLGRKTNAASGIAIQRRQDQGALATAKLFDNLLYASQVQGEKQLALVEQFISERKAFRITNMRGTPQFVEVNDGLPANDITRSKADFIISESDWHASIRQAAVEQLMEVIARMPPEVGMVLLDLAVENMDLPNREEIVKRIRGLTGQTDPDADEPSPEEQQRAKAAEAHQAMQAKTIEAQLAKLMADAKKANADALRIAAQAEEIRSRMTSTNVDSQQKALAAAREVIALPMTADVADHILAESGFKAQSDKDAALAAALSQARQPPPAGLMQPPPAPTPFP